MGLNVRFLKKVFLVLSFFVFLIIVFPTVVADDYYADLEIYVDDAGFVDIEGDTNYPDLLVSDSQEFTSMDKSLWLLNISKDDVFSNFDFKLYLPEGASIVYVKSSASIRILEESGRLVISGTGGENFSLLVQYGVERLSVFPGGLFGLVLLFIIVFLIVLFVYFYRFYDSKSSNVSESAGDFKGLNSRQRDIMKVLIKSGAGLTQTEIQKELDIPKASVSRNVRRLELKGLVEKERIGMSNIIRVKKR